MGSGREIAYTRVDIVANQSTGEQIVLTRNAQSPQQTDFVTDCASARLWPRRALSRIGGLMIDYSSWIRKNVPVAKLTLDPENPRIPPSENELSQDELLAELIEHDSVYPLAKKIATNGYYADELLIVTPKGTGYVVLEGNRRVAALKALLSPNAAPDKHRAKFRALEKRVSKSLIKSVGVLVAPSREVALPRIAEKHTRPMLENWKPAQKARFYTALLQDGRTREQICLQFDLTSGELDDFLRTGTLYQMACSLSLPENIQAKVANPRTFPLTNLERFVDSSAGQEFLGLKPDSRHIYKGSVSKEEFKKGFAKVVSDVAIGGKDGINSRKLHDNKTIRAYISSIKKYKPNETSKGSFTPHSLIAKSSQPSPSGTPNKKKATRRKSALLLPSDVRCEVDDRRIRQVFTELKTLQKRPAEYPNAIAILLRVLLDLGVSHYIQSHGKTKDLIRRFDKQGQRRADWHPSLRQQLQFLLEDMQLPLEPLELKSLKRFHEKKTDQIALDELDGFVHNKYMHPGESDLLSLFTTLSPLLRLLLADDNV